MKNLERTGALMAIVGFCMVMVISQRTGPVGLVDVAIGGLFFSGLFLFIWTRIFQKE